MKYIVKQCSGKPNEIIDIPDNAEYITASSYPPVVRWLEPATDDIIMNAYTSKDKMEPYQYAAIVLITLLFVIFFGFLIFLMFSAVGLI